jgi:HSP20 family protein
MMNTIGNSQRAFDRMNTLERVLDSAFASVQQGQPNAAGMWLPPLDVYETQHAYVIAADLPGVTPDELEIGFEQNTLTLNGTRRPTIQRREKEELRVYTAERASGSFTRSVRLPEYVDGERIDAEFAEGVLTITVPKAQSALPRKISIRATDDSRAARSGSAQASNQG